jgi:hypothetical protein
MLRSGRQNGLHEIAGFGSILRRFDQSFERLRTRGTGSGAYHHGGQSELPDFFKML